MEIFESISCKSERAGFLNKTIEPWAFWIFLNKANNLKADIPVSTNNKTINN